jgi:phosphate transport system substrate-binding protein
LIQVDADARASVQDAPSTRHPARRPLISLRPLLRALALALALIAAGASPPVRAEELRLGGTGGALGVLKRLGDAYALQHREVNVVVLPSLGSGGGIAAARDGAINLAASARPPNAAERAAGVRAAPWLRTPVAFITSRAAVPSIATATLVRFYADPAATWPDGMPVRVIPRPAGEASLDGLISQLPGFGEALASVRQRRNVPFAATDQDNVDMARIAEGSLTAATLVQLITESVALRMVTLDGVAPSVAALRAGTYSLHVEMHVVLGPQSAGETARFVAFLRSPQAAAIIEASGAVALPLSPDL